MGREKNRQSQQKQQSKNQMTFTKMNWFSWKLVGGKTCVSRTCKTIRIFMNLHDLAKHGTFSKSSFTF